MNKNQLAKIPTVDRFEADITDWETELQQIRELIDYAENYGEPSYFIGARKKIARMLEEMQHAREFIGIKREVVTEVTPDVESLFDAYRSVKRLDEPQEDRHSQDEDRLE